MKRAVASILGLSLLAAASPSVAADYPTDLWKMWVEKSTNRCPGKTWRMYATPEEAGWSSERLQQAKKHFDSIGSAALLVVHDGAVVVAWGDVTRRYMCHSVRKSLLSALVGIHVARGTLDLNKTLAVLGIDDDPPLTDAEKRARVLDLLRSRSGVYHSAAYETREMKLDRPARGTYEPGERFWYNNWDFNALGTIFEQETGTKIFEEFGRQFADALAMEDYRVDDGYYHLEQRHSIHPAYPFRMSARDMARLGLLYLREGQWRDRQILPRQWIRDSFVSHLTGSNVTRYPDYGYGYLWWPVVSQPLAALKMYSARGYGGHSIDVLPGANTVFVHRVNTFGDTAFPLKMHIVSDPDRLRLIDLVLRARVAPPKDDPQLVPLPVSRERADIVKLDPDTLSKYVGHYAFNKFEFSIKRSGSDLMLESPKIGRFLLQPTSETRFMIEDVELPVRFELDDKGNPTRLIAESVLGKPVKGQYVR
ncbi:MAG: serine hydrolase [Pirellulales bacterium]|nr:serine hydrolase [Pirellulales bacterium]